MFKITTTAKVTTYLAKNLTFKGVAFRPMAVNAAFDFKSPAAKPFVTDGTGKHTMQTSALCDEADCAQKRCYTPCGKLQQMDVEGNYTHKPPHGKSAVFLDSIDYQGQPKDQYFVKAPTTAKPQISVNQMQELTENDMVPNKTATAYALQDDILSKIK